MPGTHTERHILHQFAVTPDQQVARHLQVRHIGKVRMCIRIEAVGEQLVDLRSAVAARGQADTMDNHQFDVTAGRALITIRRWYLARIRQSINCQVWLHDLSIQVPGRPAQYTGIPVN